MSDIEKAIDRTAAKKNISETVKHVLISLAVMIMLTAAVYFFNIPNPNMILIAGLTVFTTLYGFPAGIACGIEMVLYSMFFFSTDHSFINYTTVNLQKTFIVFVGVVLNVLFIGQLKKRQQNDENRIRQINEQLRRDNISLEEASMTDALTGVKNRHALRRDYEHYRGKDLCVMMIDLDKFKQTNDDHGHEIGDKMLREAGAVLRETFGSERCYRYGGDEFLIICPDLSEEVFSNRVEELRYRAAKIFVGEERLPLHFSAGYVYGRFENDDDLRQMLRQADEAMYSAKKQGTDFCFGSAYSKSNA